MRSSGCLNSFPTFRSWLTILAETVYSSSPAASSSGFPIPSASPWRDVRRCCAFCHSRWTSGNARAPAAGSMTFCTPGVILESTIRDWNHARRSGTISSTYVERDVRRIGEIRNLTSFRRFVRLCAGRVGQLLNLASLGDDAGVSHTTARHWISILEASYVVFQLPPFFANIRKRLIKSPKLYFYDVGLASYLIGIEHAGQIATHPLRGGLFENAVVAEAIKHRFNRGRRSNLSFFRDTRGLECDLLYEMGNRLGAIEIKSGATVTSDYFDALNRIARLLPQVSDRGVVYGGSVRQSRRDVEVVTLAEVSDLLERVRQTATKYDGSLRQPRSFRAFRRGRRTVVRRRWKLLGSTLKRNPLIT